MKFKYEISLFLLISISHLVRSSIDLNTIKNILLPPKVIKCYDCNGEGNPACNSTINEKNLVKIKECEKGAKGCVTQLAETSLLDEKIIITNRGCYFEHIEYFYTTNFTCGGMNNNANEKNQICHKCKGDLCNFKNGDDITYASNGLLVWCIIAASFVVIMILITCLINKCV